FVATLSPACVQTLKLRRRKRMGQAKPPHVALASIAAELWLLAFLPVRRRRCSPSSARCAGTRLRSGGAPNSAPSLCSVAGLLVAKWVPPTSTPSDFPPRFMDNTLRLAASRAI